MATKPTVEFMGREYRYDHLDLYSRAAPGRMLVILEDSWEPMSRRFRAVTQGQLGGLFFGMARGRTKAEAVSRLEAKCHTRFRRVGALMGYDVD